MIRFHKVRFRNFGSFGNNGTEIHLDKHRTTLVSGMNGHGKSFALLDSITFALFGKPFRKINIPQLINSINEKDCYVEVDFSIGDDEYQVHRGIKPKIFEIYKNQELIDQNAKAKDYQRMLEENILKMNYKSFTQVVILGSSSFVPFMQLTAADRRDVIEDVLDIQVFSNMNTVLKSRASLKKEEIKTLENNIVLNKDRIAVIENHVEKLIEANESKVKSLEEELSTTNNLIETEEVKLNDLLNEQQKLIDQLSELDTLKERLNKYENMEKLILNSLKKSKEKISFFEDNESCPTCTQTIHNETKGDVLSQLNEKKNEFEQASSDIRDQIEEIRNGVNGLTVVSRKSSECHTKVVDTKSTIESSRRYANKLIEEIKNTTQQENDSSIDETKKNLEVLNEDKNKLMEKKNELKEEGVLLGCVGNLLKDTGIKSKIIRHYLPIMNKLINKFLSDMGFFAQFHLDENFNETIKSRFRDSFSYMSFSEGEKMRIDLALLLAWREIARIKNSANTNLLILDEVFDSSLDSVGTEEFMKLMSILSANTHVFVISHKSDQLVDKFDEQITFVKSGNFSRII
jgi:DNA repair exonuclease SbcCD ATPase subunit